MALSTLRFRPLFKVISGGGNFNNFGAIAPCWHTAHSGFFVTPSNPLSFLTPLRTFGRRACLFALSCFINRQSR